MHHDTKTSSLEEKLSSYNGLSASQKNAAGQNLWDFFTSAYASGKAVKTLLYSLSAGYSPQAALAASAGLYTGIKLVGKGLKSAFNYIRGKPVQYRGFRKELGDFLEELNPFGPYRRPVSLGAGISGLSYLTGF